MPSEVRGTATRTERKPSLIIHASAASGRAGARREAPRLAQEALAELADDRVGPLLGADLRQRELLGDGVHPEDETHPAAVPAQLLQTFGDGEEGRDVEEARQPVVPDREADHREEEVLEHLAGAPS
jgi:hypothetical protein